MGELTGLGSASVIIFGLVLGLGAHAFNLRRFDRWVLLLILGTFTGAYALTYFAQEFISLNMLNRPLVRAEGRQLGPVVVAPEPQGSPQRTSP